MSEFIGFCFWFIVLCFGLGVCCNELDSYQCHSKWKHSGMQVNYSFSSGCQVKLHNGIWVPASSILYQGNEK